VTSGSRTISIVQLSTAVSNRVNMRAITRVPGVSFTRGLSPRVWVLAVLAGGPLSSGLATAQTPEEDFKACMVCHTVGRGRLVGPDLIGINDRRDQAWLIPYIVSSQTVINSGDEYAVKIFEENNKLVMPDSGLSEAQVIALLEYIKNAPAEGYGLMPAGPTNPATAAEIALGRDLFEGQVSLTNGGPACNSCHDVTGDFLIGGGVLARELTKVFSRLGGPGVRAIIGSPPFPVMQKAYEDRPLTEDEVNALVGFLEKSNTDQASHMPRDTGFKLALTGILGAALLLAMYSMFWPTRKRASVNQAIYDRQVKSI